MGRASVGDIVPGRGIHPFYFDMTGRAFAKALRGFFVERWDDDPDPGDGPDDPPVLSYTLTLHGHGASFYVTINDAWFSDEGVPPVTAVSLTNPRDLFGPGARSVEGVSRLLKMALRPETESDRDPDAYCAFVGDPGSGLTVYFNGESVDHVLILAD